VSELALELLSSLTSSVDLEKFIPQMAVAENPTPNQDNQPGSELQTTNGKAHQGSPPTSESHELVHLLSSDEDEEKKNSKSMEQSKDLET
jgi:hypothetical protein